jgi:histidine triad (HIT) family protein
LIVTAKQVADDQGIKDSGYKLVFNVGKDGGQVIEHIHLHLLGGKPLGE